MQTNNLNQTLFEALLNARKKFGGRKKILEDMDRKPCSYNRLIVISRVLGAAFARFSQKGQCVGVLLPNSIGAAATFFGLLAEARVPVMLNFAAGVANLKSAAKTAQLAHVVTSRQFVERAEIQPVIDALIADLAIVYLEDLKERMNPLAKLWAILSLPFAGLLYKRHRARAEDPAVILFTSGSESAPKGVALSHRNLIANRYQSHALIDLNPEDTLFNALPVFHSFGLSVGLVLPLFTGTRTFLYPSPLHYHIIPDLIHETQATILISTDTFLRGYAKHASAADLYSLRLVVAGGEKLKEPTRIEWHDLFGIDVLQGYGVTETSPVLAVNTFEKLKHGTVGQIVPDVEYRLRPIEGIAKGGSLVVRGPNVMLGYMRSDRPGVIQPQDEWYDTGDVVEVDEEGFVTIVGRAKRFAKIGGEMISLAAVEEYVRAGWPEQAVGAVAIPDPRKGEVIVLFTDAEAITKDEIAKRAKALQLPELMIPQRVIALEAFPVLGTGKTDYIRLSQIARERILS